MNNGRGDCDLALQLSRVLYSSDATVVITSGRPSTHTHRNLKIKKMIARVAQSDFLFEDGDVRKNFQQG